MSGRVEETNRPTVVALANSTSSTLLLSSQQKRLLLSTLKMNHPHWSATQRHVFVFAHLVALLIQPHLEELQQIVIDPEYSGYEPIIKDRILNYWRHIAISRLPNIVFGYVGKQSPAHALAISVFRGEIKAAKIISATAFFRTFNKK